MLLVIVTVAFAAFTLLALYGRFAARPRGVTTLAFDTHAAASWLDRAVSPLISRHDGKIGLRLVTDNVEAFALRAAAARRAERSLDLQYYYWKNDLTGGLLAREIVAAADRGVRVRLLLDDVNAWGRDTNYRALDRHPNIEVRLFNPLRCREGVVLRGIEMIMRFWSVNRRMHHKAWIADGRVLLMGGRNIGDAYFDAAEASNFRDMDVLALGPAVRQAEQVFDSYWNSAVVAPIRDLPDWLERAELGLFRRRLEKLFASGRGDDYVIAADKAMDELVAESVMHWCSDAEVVSDPPEKALSNEADGWLLRRILPAISSAKQSLQITSPYFIPLDSGARLLANLAGAGVSISVLTNSLAATDVTAAYGAYMRFRKPLLAAGVRLFELRARGGRKDVSLFGSRGASLHTKAFVVDGAKGFVGSFNFDPRSVSLNTEMGLFFDHAGLAQEMQAVFSAETTAKHSFRLAMDGDRLVWRDGDLSPAEQEPDAGVRRRLMAGAVSLLPVESQL
jgi:putative cardiolipin synthase